MHKLILGSGLTLMAMGGAVAAETPEPTPAGVVVMTENPCPAPTEQEGKIKGRVVTAGDKGTEFAAPNHIARSDLKHADIKGADNPPAQEGTVKGKTVKSGDNGARLAAPDHIKRSDIKHADMKIKHSGNCGPYRQSK